MSCAKVSHRPASPTCIISPRHPKRPWTLSVQSWRKPLRLSAVSIKLVPDGIRQGLERGIHDVRGHTHRRPAIALAVRAFDPDAGLGFRAAGEDTHFIIRQLEVGEIGR